MTDFASCMKIFYFTFKSYSYHFNHFSVLALEPEVEALNAKNDRLSQESTVTVRNIDFPNSWYTSELTSYGFLKNLLTVLFSAGLT